MSNSLIPQDEFRTIIKQAKVVVDSAPNYQKGLTARMMWCLGLGAKVLTTNTYIKNYPFYNPDQVYILTKEDDLTPEILKQFVDKHFSQSPEYSTELLKYRIDNWVNCLMSVGKTPNDIK